jgi:hypothetical protein
MREGGLLTLGTNQLRSERFWQKVVAHEMAHWINEDIARRERLWRESGYNRSVFLRQVQALELEADAKAIEIFQRVAKWTEQDAVTLFYNYYQAVRIAVTQGMVLPDGHPPACEKINFLRTRFPAHAEWMKPC